MAGDQVIGRTEFAGFSDVFRRAQREGKIVVADVDGAGLDPIVAGGADIEGDGAAVDREVFGDGSAYLSGRWPYRLRERVRLVK